MLRDGSRESKRNSFISLWALFSGTSRCSLGKLEQYEADALVPGKDEGETALGLDWKKAVTPRNRLG
jgi:hypothetical protein